MPPSCALLGGFAIGAPVALLWQQCECEMLASKFTLCLVSDYTDTYTATGLYKRKLLGIILPEQIFFESLIYLLRSQLCQISDEMHRVGHFVFCSD